ncbi:MAG: NAD(P)/FAD-dependent oxidoreductase [Candidatus Hodarchaeales archaeon]|jgi:flavin-dependent dehydrogenase
MNSKANRQEIAIIGGNIAGLASAYYLSKKGFIPIIYEPKIWNKPCGGAITIEFDHYLRNEFGIFLDETDVYIPRMKVGLWTGNHVDVEGVFTITTRYDLQEKITEKLKEMPDVHFVQKQVKLTEKELFTPQTVIATGFTGFTRKIMDRNWNFRDRVQVLRFDGHIENKSHPNSHLIVLDNKMTGYGWVFLGEGNHINIGLGGVGQTSFVWNRYYEFFKLLKDKYGYEINPEEAKPQGWGLPVPINKWKFPVSNFKDNVEFIGVGDVLGLAHPILGAGIEPAWQSGWILGESIDKSINAIDTAKYQKLLAKNISLSSGRRLDHFMALMMRNKFLPFKDKLGYIALKLLMNHMINKMRDYPWFGLVSDGERKTGFTVPISTSNSSIMSEIAINQ